MERTMNTTYLKRSIACCIILFIFVAGMQQTEFSQGAILGAASVMFAVAVAGLCSEEWVADAPKDQQDG